MNLTSLGFFICELAVNQFQITKEIIIAKTENKLINIIDGVQSCSLETIKYLLV
jgi:hypothetical protein